MSTAATALLKGKKQVLILKIHVMFLKKHIFSLLALREQSPSLKRQLEHKITVVT